MIEEIYINAMLADAAYVDFDISQDINPDTGIIKPTARDLFVGESGRGWTDEQFTWFQNNFRVYRNANGDLAHQQNTDSGFAATMFEFVGLDVPSIPPGSIFFSARGTEEEDVYNSEDLLYDAYLATGNEVDIRAFILGHSQISDLDDFIKTHFLANDGTLNQNLLGNVNYNGHSLGGHLATIASAGGNQGRLEESYGSLIRSAFGNLSNFNSAGIHYNSPLWDDLVSDLVENNRGQSTINL